MSIYLDRLQQYSETVDEVQNEMKNNNIKITMHMHKTKARV